MAQSRTLYVGREGHKESMAVASGAQAHGAAVLSLGPLGPRQCASESFAGRCGRKASSSASSTQPVPAALGASALS